MHHQELPEAVGLRSDRPAGIEPGQFAEPVATNKLLDQGVVAFFSTWELYGTAIAGVGALFMLQNALQAGSLIAVQPPLTLGDALISACYGVTVFGENVQTGGWLLAVEIVAVLAIAAGCIELSRSLALVHAAEQPEPAG